ncbi:hypothetical protein LTR78_001978 [Recurvomyces mirabilis]|uniref:HORMA domain-containing protein n=1 Tax=Recurvomyces mirabilis TaxID=574656 RepID=A0AAE1C4R7_9PEZI|nr:hypothetical protein LTR78_001978 [Recurvomyces mirabilis]KAK5160436.1 hypothetical protein LTS14_001448 [Recurvomyces mirabilis]
MPDDAATFRMLISQFTDFLTVAIHTVLYERNIYPQTSFLSARKYNFAVRQSRHPKVCEWINDAVAAVETELLKGNVERVAVVVYNKGLKPTERFLFDVSRFPPVSFTDVDTPLERKDSGGKIVPILPLIDIEEQFRATMSKLANCGTVLKPAPVGGTFTVAIELKGDGQAPISHPQPWMPVEPILDKDTANMSQKRAHPIRAVAAGDLIFESWIEEAREAD